LIHRKDNRESSAIVYSRIWGEGNKKVGLFLYGQSLQRTDHAGANGGGADVFVGVAGEGILHDLAGVALIVDGTAVDGEDGEEFAGSGSDEDRIGCEEVVEGEVFLFDG